jgi:hypothetical protein
MLQLIVIATLSQSPSSLDARVEIQLIPITAQANTLKTEHFGSGGRIAVRLNRYLAGYVSGFGYWHTTPSAELDTINRRTFRIDLYVPEQALSTWHVAGIESIPLSGTFQVGDSRSGDFGLVVRAGIGVGGSRIRLKPPATYQDGSVSPATWGDLDVRLVGDFGLAFRFSFGAFAIHLGPRLSMWSDEANRVNGCSSDDLRAMDMKIRAGLPHVEASVSPGCTGIANSNDVPLAFRVVRTPRSGVVINVSADLGVSWSF